MDILQKIDSPEDVKKLNASELYSLCDEIRELIIETVADTGGHLSSNLGAVELTVAIHRVYDTSRDRLVFDVGHQSYAHKILTGRRDEFPTLRQLGGIAGYPKPSESEHDAFIAGHASNSISVALGMARARTAAQEDYSVAALIGDGALTGGLAYEGLADAGVSVEPLVLILNDNGMSINKNVGGMAAILSDMRTSPGYLAFKRGYRRTIGKLPPLYRFFHRIKEWLKSALLPHNIFDELGLYYLGPVDGEDVLALETALAWAKDLKIPVLLHVITQKGSGYPHAEAQPDLFHSVSSFNPLTGVIAPEAECFSSVFGDKLTELAEKDEKIVAITAAMSHGAGLDGFKEKFPERFFDVGIAEGHATAMAGGMAKQGLTPVFAVYSSFLQRAYDMLLHDIALLKLHAVFAVDRAGLVPRDGETHQGVFDVSYLCSVPNMAVFAPSNFDELREMLEMAINAIDGPVALRYPRGGEGALRGSYASAPAVVLREGGDLTLAGYGILINELLEAAEALSKRGISAGVVKLNLINPLDIKTVSAAVKSSGRLIVAEDVCGPGCVGERILSELCQLGESPKSARLLNLGSGIVTHGDVEQLLSLYGLDAAGITRASLEMLNNAVFQ